MVSAGILSTGASLLGEADRGADSAPSTSSEGDTIAAIVTGLMHLASHSSFLAPGRCDGGKSMNVRCLRFAAILQGFV